MTLFEKVKENVTANDAAITYGFKPNRSKLICCPFHDDKHPSMKVDKRYFCFGCGAKGDVIDFASNLYGLNLKEAAMKLASDFGISYEEPQSESIKMKIMRKEKQIQKSKAREWELQKREMFSEISKLHQFLHEKKIEYAPKEDSNWSSLFQSAVNDFQYVDYLYEYFILQATDEEQKKEYTNIRKELKRIERKYEDTDWKCGRSKDHVTDIREWIAV